MRLLSFLSPHYDFVKKYLLTASLQFINFFLPLLAYRYFLTQVGAEKFGLSSFSSAFILYFTLIINFGFDYSSTREIASARGDKEMEKKIFWSTLSSKSLLFFAAFVLFSIILLTQNELKENYILHLSSFLICIGYLFYPSWYFQGTGRINQLLSFSIISKVLFLIAVILLINQEKDFILFNILLSSAHLLLGLFLFIYVIKKYAFNYYPHSLADILVILKKGSYIFFSTIINNLYTNTNIFLLGFMATHEDVAFFSMPQKIIAGIYMVFNVPINQILLPTISVKFQESTKAGNSELKKLSIPVLFGGAIISLFILLFAKEILQLIYNSDYPEAVNIMRILSPIPFLVSISSLFGIIGLLSLKKDKLSLTTTITGAIFSLAINLYLVPHYYAKGGASGLLATEALIAILSFIAYNYTIKRRLKENQFS